MPTLYVPLAGGSTYWASGYRFLFASNLLPLSPGIILIKRLFLDKARIMWRDHWTVFSRMYLQQPDLAGRWDEIVTVALVRTCVFLRNSADDRPTVKSFVCRGNGFGEKSAHASRGE
jgi:hypothetical protein